MSADRVANAETCVGHWGTCPGLSIVYSHLNRIVSKHDLDVVLVVGPGHGAPAILASLWIEGSLQRFYPQFGRDKEGLSNLITQFSTPGGPPRSVGVPRLRCCRLTTPAISTLRRQARSTRAANSATPWQSRLARSWTIPI